jgi:hypothetical protein
MHARERYLNGSEDCEGHQNQNQNIYAVSPQLGGWLHRIPPGRAVGHKAQLKSARTPLMTCTSLQRPARGARQPSLLACTKARLVALWAAVR